MLDASKSNGHAENPIAAGAGGQQPSFGDFAVDAQLGEGSFSTVFKATHNRSGTPVALKVCDKQRLAREGKGEYAERERLALQLLEAHPSPSAPFFVRLWASFEDAHAIYFALSLAPNGDLLSLLERRSGQPLPTDAVRFYGAEVVVALEHLRSLAVVHRDLKPSNLLLQHNWHIALSDFGTAKVLDEEHMKPPDPEADAWADPAPEGASGHEEEDGEEEEPLPRGQSRRWSFVGSALYVSPEVLRGRPVSHCTDLWALGVCLFQMATTKPPFREESDFLTFKKILALDYAFPEGLDPALRTVVEHLLMLRPGRRLAACDEGPRYVSLRDSDFFKGLQLDEVYQSCPPALERLCPPQDAVEG